MSRAAMMQQQPPRRPALAPTGTGLPCSSRCSASVAGGIVLFNTLKNDDKTAGAPFALPNVVGEQLDVASQMLQDLELHNQARGRADGRCRRRR